MRHRATLVLSASLLLPAACSNSGAMSSGSGGSTSTTSGSTSSSSGSFDAGAVVTTYTTGMGPIMLSAGEEVTNCITVPLGNAAGGIVRRFRADLQPGSHHMIVYTSTATTPDATPTPCQPFAGIIEGEHPVFIAQQPMAELVFPTAADGTPIGFEVQANQMLKVEFHTINTTQAPISVTGTAYIDTVPLTTNATLSDIAFWGTKKFTIPAHGTFDTTPDGGVPLFQQGIPGTQAFAVTTHQHELGTEMKVWYSAAPGDTSDLIADCTNWANPPLVLLDPALQYPTGETKGMSYECHWNNTTSSPVTFGESFYDEMCFLWQYYYPTQGFQLCLDGKCQ